MDEDKKIIKQILLPFVGDDLESDDALDTAANDWLVYFQTYSVSKNRWYKEISHVMGMRAHFDIISICAPTGDEVI